MRIESSANFTVRNCTFSDASKDYFFLSTSTAYITGNTFLGNVE